MVGRGGGENRPLHRRTVTTTGVAIVGETEVADKHCDSDAINLDHLLDGIIKRCDSFYESGGPGRENK